MEPTQARSQSEGPDKKTSRSRRVSSDSDGSGSSSQDDAESRQMKKTCENCVKCKIRCEGGNPCTRCLKRGVDCVFLVEQKRGRRPGPLAVTSAPAKRKRQSEKESSSSIAKTTVMQELQQTKHDSSRFSSAVASPFHNHQQLTTQILSKGPFTHSSPESDSRNPFLMNQYMMLLQSNSLGSNAWQGYMSRNFMPANIGIHPSVLQTPGLTEPTETLNVFERRMIRTLFALFKHHHETNEKLSSETLQRLNWFDMRFGFLVEFLRTRISPHELNSLKTWMAKHGMNPAASERNAAILMNAMVRSPKFSNLRPSQPLCGDQGKMKLGVLFVLPNGYVECDPMAQQLLGYTSQYFTRKQGWPSGGLVPWGTEIIAQIAARDEDVFAYAEQVLSRLSEQRDSTQRGPTSARTERPISIVHRNSIVMNCTVSAEVVEVEISPSQRISGLESITQGVAVHVYMADPATQSSRDNSIEHLAADVANLGPWSNNGSKSWLSSLLAWA